MSIVQDITYSRSKRGNWCNGAMAGGIIGATGGLSWLVYEVTEQADLLRCVKDLKPILEKDKFEHLKGMTKPEVFEHITTKEKYCWKPILKKLGITAVCIAGGIYLGNYLDKIIKTNKKP